jgi:hypothetical protein
VTPPEPGRVLRLALVGWGLGHIAIGRHALGRALLLAEVIGVAVVAWLTIGLADTSAYLVPFLAGTAFIVAWAWQAVDAYRSARLLVATPTTTPERSPAAAIGWLSLPLLVWGTGFWLIGAHSGTPAAVLDRFVSEWTTQSLAAEWPASVRRAARASGPPPGADLRIRITGADASQATAVAEAIHYERRDARFLGILPGTALEPVADERLLTLELTARPVELPGGGDIGAVRWELVSAAAP